MKNRPVVPWWACKRQILFFLIWVFVGMCVSGSKTCLPKFNDAQFYLSRKVLTDFKRL